MATSTLEYLAGAAAAASIYDLVTTKRSAGLFGLASAAAVWLYARNRDRKPDASAGGEEVRSESVRTSYDQCGSQVTIFERVSSTRGTVGFRALVDGPNSRQERLFGAAALGDAMAWADAVACS